METGGARRGSHDTLCMSAPLRSRRLSDEEIEEFRKILNESTGHDFSSKDTAKLADMLMNILTLVQATAVQYYLED